MTKITQKQLRDNLVSAFASGSATQLKSILDLGSHKQQNAVYFSEIWKNIVTQNSSQLTPHKAFGFARIVSNFFGSMEPFKVFVENCPPLEVYLRSVKEGQKPSIVATIQKWVFDSFINAHEDTSNLFVLLNQKLDPAVAKLDPQDFLGKNELWWPTVNPHIMQTLVDIQPNFLKELQKAVIKNLDETTKHLNAITQSNTIANKKILEKIVADVLGNQRPFLYILMRPYVENILLHSRNEKSWANDISICALQGETYISLAGLQVWNKYKPLHNTQLMKLHTMFSSLDVKNRERVMSFATVEVAFSNIEVTELLHICQNAYITNQLGTVHSLTSARKI